MIGMFPVKPSQIQYYRAPVSIFVEGKLRYDKLGTTKPTSVYQNALRGGTGNENTRCTIIQLHLALLLGSRHLISDIRNDPTGDVQQARLAQGCISHPCSLSRYIPGPVHGLSDMSAGIIAINPYEGGSLRALRLAFILPEDIQ